MTVHNEMYIFVYDFVLFQHQSLDETVGKVMKIFTKVCVISNV